MVIDRLHLCKCKKLRYSSEKKRPLPFDRVHKDSKWQKLFSPGHYSDYWFIYLWKLFLCSRAAGEKEGEGTPWFEIYGSSCAPSQILAFHLTSAVETKVLSNPSEHSHSSLVVLLSDPLVGSVQITGNCLDFHSLMGFY